MIDSDGIIKTKTVSGVTYGVSVSDLQTVFTTSKNDVGAIVLFIAARDLVNVWTKYKAVRSSKRGVLTEAERKEVMYGLDIPVCTTSGGVATFLLAYPNGYSYLWPRGLKNTDINPGTLDEWFRLLDFDGYNPAANCFVNSNDILLPSSYIVGNGGTGLYFEVGINAGASLRTGAIGITDLPYGNGTFGDLYLGMLFVYNGAYKLITSSQTLSTDVSFYGHGSVFLAESNNLLDGITTNTEYDVYPVLSLLSHTSMTSYSQQDELVALPVSPFTFKATTLVTQQNIAILSAGATMNDGVLLVDFVLAMSAQGAAATSMTASYTVYEASESGDTTGDPIQGMSGTTPLSTSQNAQVQKQRRMTNPQWVRIYACNQNNNLVNTQRWARVRTGGDIDPFDPTPTE